MPVKICYKALPGSISLSVTNDEVIILLSAPGDDASTRVCDLQGRFSQK